MKISIWSIVFYILSVLGIYFSIYLLLEIINSIISTRFIIVNEKDYFNMRLNLIFGFTLGYILIHSNRAEQGLNVNIYTLLTKIFIVFISLLLSITINLFIFSKRETDFNFIIYLKRITTLWIEFPIVTIGVLLIKNVRIDFPARPVSSRE
jgi:hypothetical protein